MPTKEELDLKALDYGVLVAGIEKMKVERTTLEADIETAKAAKARLDTQVKEAEEAFARLHKEVTDTEKELEEKRRLKNEEIDNEDRRLAAERASLAEALKQHSEIADALDKREADVLSRENQTKDREKELDSKQRKLTELSFEVDEKAKKADATLKAAEGIQREVETQLTEVGKRARDAKAAESSAKSAQENATRLATKASDDQLAAANDRRVAEDSAAKTQKKLDQLTGLLAVMEEHVAYIAEHAQPKQLDAILNHFGKKYPELASVLVPPNPKTPVKEPKKVVAPSK